MYAMPTSTAISTIVVQRGVSKGTAAAVALLNIPRGAGVFEAATRKQVAQDYNEKRSTQQRICDEKRTWASIYQKPAITAIITIIYAIYPISLLLMFRISETISATRLFEHHHRCHHLGEKGHCLQLIALHGQLFFAWLGLIFCYRGRRELPCSFAALLAAISVITLGIYKGLVDGYLLFDPSSLDASRTNLTGRVAVITGANQGIGLETARTLARMGAHVVMTCRSMEKCKPFVDDINSDKKVAGSASAAVLDLRSLESATLLASDLRQTYPIIDFVFCNAGTTPQYELTQDGFEDAFGGMHLAHMTLVLGLLPSLQYGRSDNEPSRVILVSSEMAINTVIGVFSPRDPSLSEFFSKNNVRGEITRGNGKFPYSLPAYGRAKLFNILFALELNRRMAAKSAENENMRPVIANAVHTGAVNTASSRHSIQRMFAEKWPKWGHPGLCWLVSNVYFPLLWRPVQGGARVLLCAALSQEDAILRGGQYLDALCHPFLPSEEDDAKVLESIQSGEAHEDTVRIQRWDVTIFLDAIQALQLADARWSKHLFEMSLELLEGSPAAKYIELVAI